MKNLNNVNSSYTNNCNVYHLKKPKDKCIKFIGLGKNAMNILVSTLGLTWSIVPELLGLTNPGSVRLFENYPKTSILTAFRSEIAPVDEAWIILTRDNQSKETLAQVRKWESLLSPVPTSDIESRFRLIINRFLQKDRAKAVASGN